MNPCEPSWSEQARTTLDVAGVATLLTRSAHSPCTMTIVAIETQLGGSPRVWVEASARPTATLAESPLATLVVPAAAPFRCLNLGGRLLPSAEDSSGCQPYDMTIDRAELIGTTTSVVIPVNALLKAKPDPIRHDASAILEHLQVAHQQELLACARAHGMSDITSIIPRRLDRYGFELVALSAAGVTRLRLSFPNGPIESIADLGLDLQIQMGCRCTRPPSGRARGS